MLVRLDLYSWAASRLIIHSRMVDGDMTILLLLLELRETSSTSSTCGQEIDQVRFEKESLEKEP